MRERPSAGWVQETMMMVVEGGWAAGCGTELWNIRGTDAGGGPPDKGFLSRLATLRILGASVDQGRAPREGTSRSGTVGRRRAVGARVESREWSCEAHQRFRASRGRASQPASQPDRASSRSCSGARSAGQGQIHTLWQHLRPGNFAPFFARRDAASLLPPLSLSLRSQCSGAGFGS
ncbi:hypothetical protein L1887_54970 [Cichorium endivia]|nr:hypothetical protein L1887_54970 [Cichorium endivia]